MALAIIDSTKSLKGLANGPGENNCFLNSTIQILWHLPVFRRSLSSLYGHYCMQDKCVFCAFKTLFIQLEQVDKAAIPPNVLRQAMAGAFHSEDRFQLGQMDDAAECYEHILSRLHYHLTSNCPEDACTSQHCITHAKFAMNIFEQSCCGCGEQSEPLGYSQVMQYVSASAITRVVLEKKGNAGQLSFGRYIHLAIGSGDLRMCPGGCKKEAPVRRYLMNSPSVFCMGVVWNSNSTPVEEIMTFVNAIESTITIDDVFHKVTDSSAMGRQLQLVGIIMYYGQHYSSLFLSQTTKKWTYFDDSRVRVLDEKLSTVKDLCKRGHYQPLLLVYADPNGVGVKCEGAPPAVIPMNKQQAMETLRLDSPLNRSISKRRSLSSVTSPVHIAQNGGAASAVTAATAIAATTSSSNSSSSSSVAPKPIIVSDLVDLQESPAAGMTPSMLPPVEKSKKKATAPPQPAPSAPVDTIAPPATWPTTAKSEVPVLSGASPPRPRQEHGAFNAEQRRELQQMRDQMNSGRTGSSKAEAQPSNSSSIGFENFSKAHPTPVTAFSSHAEPYRMPAPVVQGSATMAATTLPQQISQHTSSSAGIRGVQPPKSTSHSPFTGLSKQASAPPDDMLVNPRPVAMTAPHAQQTATVPMGRQGLRHTSIYSQAKQPANLTGGSTSDNRPRPSVSFQRSSPTPASALPSQQSVATAPQHTAVSAGHAVVDSRSNCTSPATISRPAPMASAYPCSGTSRPYPPIVSTSRTMDAASALSSSQTSPHSLVASTTYAPIGASMGYTHAGVLRPYPPIVSTPRTVNGAVTPAGSLMSSHPTMGSSATFTPILSSAGPVMSSAQGLPIPETNPEEIVDNYCMEAENLMVRAGEMNSESKLKEAAEFLHDARVAIEAAAQAAKGDQSLLLTVNRQAALIQRCQESQERRLLSVCGGSASLGIKGHDEVDGGQGVPRGSVKQPAVRCVQGVSGGCVRSAAGAPALVGNLLMPSAANCERSPSPTPAAVDLFFASFGGVHEFNTEPSNYSEAYRAMHAG